MMANERCELRSMEARDLAQVLAWRNHPNVRRFMLTQHEISMPEHEQWFERAARDPNLKLLIASGGDSDFGFVSLRITSEHHRAEWGFYIAPDAPRGSGTRLGQAAVAHAFDDLGLHKLCGQALSFNLPSIRFHEKLGFQTEGLLKQHAWINQQFHDLVIFGLATPHARSTP